MDALTIGLLATGVAGGIALWLKNRSDSESFQSEDRPIRAPKKTGWQQQHLPLDPQTRLLERPKRQYRLLNDAEQELYLRLLEAMPNMRIFAQVGVAQLAQLRGRLDVQRLRGMASRGVDFVVCGSDFAIVAAIELAWPTPGGETTAEDEKQAALASLGIPLIIFRPNHLPNADVISREIADAIVRRNRLENERY
ncbi:MAG: hypothetical protein H6R15_3893 [Proteobacteria bacterium]|nr:hypothetical protein [Pseudomonadota bacterium]